MSIFKLPKKCLCRAAYARSGHKSPRNLHSRLSLFIITMLILVQPTIAGMVEIKGVPVYKQNDPAWKDVKYDNSKTGQTIGTDGCTLTIWAMIFSHAAKKNGIKDKDGKDVGYTPLTLNQLLTQKDAFNKDELGKVTGISAGSMIKAIEEDTKTRDKEGKGLKQKRYWNPGSPDGEGGKIPTIDPNGILVKDYDWIRKMIVEKKLPIEVRVDAVDVNTVNGEVTITKRYPNGHSVLVIGYDDETKKYKIIDPLWDVDYLDHPYIESRIYEFDGVEMIPEPTTMFLLGLGGLALLRRRRGKNRLTRDD